MILTHGANSLPRGGIPGVWTLDIPNLELTDHTDADGIRYVFNNITKINDGQALYGTPTYGMLVEDISKLGRIKKVTLTGKLIISTGNNYIGLTGVSFTTSRFWIGSNLGVWLWMLTNSSEYDWTIHVPYSAFGNNDYRGDYVWKAYKLLDITNPSMLNYEFIYDVEGRDQLLLDGVVIASRKTMNDIQEDCPYSLKQACVMNSGGVGYSGAAELYSLNVYYENGV